MASVKTDRLVERSPVFYGWIVWAVATVGLLASSPGQSFSVSLFFDHFIADLGLSRTTVSALYSIGTLTAALSLTFVGRWVDRVGNRRSGSLIALGLALALAFMSLVTGPIMLVFGFVLIRGLGQGGISLTSLNVIAQWFRQRRGLTTGITAFVYMFSQGLIINGLTKLIQSEGWRTAWLVQAVVIGFVVLPLTALFIRTRPEDYGLQPDGAQQTTDRPGRPAPAVEVDFTLRQAMRTPIFWVFLLLQTLNAGWVSGLIIHQISLFATMGYGPTVPVQTLSLATTLAAGLTLAAGPLTNRVRPQVIAAGQMLLLGGALALGMIMTTRLLTVAYGVLLGGLLGIWPIFDGVIWPNLFGRQHYGSIRGVVQTATVAGSAAGPILFSLCFDAAGTYNAALGAGVILATGVLVASLLVRPPTLQAAGVDPLSGGSGGQGPNNQS